MQFSNLVGEEVLVVLPGVVGSVGKASDGPHFRSGEDGGGEPSFALGILKLL